MKTQLLDLDDENRAVELVDLVIDRLDGVRDPAHGRGFILRKSADVKHPNQDNARHLRERGSLETDDPLGNLDPKMRQAFEFMLGEIRKLSAEVRELKAADRQHANSLLRKSGPTPASKQTQGHDDHVLVHKSALNGGKQPGLFTSVIFPSNQ